MIETTQTVMPAPKPLKRVSIIGTAPSWKQCPWNDPTMEIWGLNDGYLLGTPRATRWYDLHPIYQMNFRPADQRQVDPRDVPVGCYLRPHGHLDWLRSRPFPVVMAEKSEFHPNALVFPWEKVFEAFRPYWPWRVTRSGQIKPGSDYEVSTPSLMLMHAITEGYTEIHVYGIHLATQWEYVEQRPNFEFLLGVAAGKGLKLVLPECAPICKASYRYACEPKADIPVQQAQQAIQFIKQEGLHLRQQLAALPWYAIGDKADIEARLKYLDVELLDAKGTLGRLQTLALAS